MEPRGEIPQPISIENETLISNQETFASPSQEDIAGTINRQPTVEDIDEVVEATNELLPSPESFELLAKECEQVRELAEKVSEDFRVPLPVLFNGSAGTFFHIGMDTISTQLNRQFILQARESGVDEKQFAEDQRNQFANEWQQEIQKIKAESTNPTILQLARKSALLAVGHRWITGNRLKFLTVSEIDVKYPSSDENDYRERTLDIVEGLPLYSSPFMFVDWSDRWRQFPESMENRYLESLNGQRAVVPITNYQEPANEDGWLERLYNQRPVRIDGAVIKHTQRKNLADLQREERKDFIIYFSPLHVSEIEGERKGKGEYEPYWKYSWITDFPAGVSFERGELIKGRRPGAKKQTQKDKKQNQKWLQRMINDAYLSIDVKAEGIDKSKDLYTQAQYNAVKAVREQMRDSEGNNWFDRKEKYSDTN